MKRIFENPLNLFATSIAVLLIIVLMQLAVHTLGAGGLRVAINLVSVVLGMVGNIGILVSFVWAIVWLINKASRTN